MIKALLNRYAELTLACAAYSFQTFSALEVLGASKMNQIEVNVRDHRHGSDGVNSKVFPSGTRMVFQQTSAPTGWTKESAAAYNDAALRFTTGTVSAGGAVGFNTTFGNSMTTAGTSLSMAHMPGVTFYVAQGGSGRGDTTPGTNDVTGSGGSGQPHTHILSHFNIKYADCIIAAQDA